MVATLQRGQAFHSGTLVYVPGTIDLSGLGPTELRVLRALGPAVDATDSLFYLQRGGQRGLDAYNVLRAVARGTKDPGVTEYYFEVSHNGGVYDIRANGERLAVPFDGAAWRKEAKGAVKRGEVDAAYRYFTRAPKFAPRGGNVFVNATDMPDEKFKKWADGELDRVWKCMTEPERQAKSHPLLQLGTRAVVTGSKGRYIVEQTPWAQYEPTRPYVTIASDAFHKASKIAEHDFPWLARILRQTAIGMYSGNFNARDLLLPRNDSNLYVFGGLTEEYVGAKLGWEFSKRGGFDLVLSSMNPEVTALAGRAKKLVPKFIAKLPKELRNTSISDITIHGLNISFLAGDTQHDCYTPSARNWPNNESLKDAAPYIVFHTGDGAAITQYLEMPAAAALMPEGEVPTFEAVAAHKRELIILHEICHTVGDRLLYNQSLEEGKATAGAFFYLPMFASSENLGGKALKEFCNAMIPRVVRAVKSGYDTKTGSIQEHHAVGENVLLQMCIDSGAVEVGGGKLEALHPREIFKVAGEYFVKGAELEHHGTPQQIERFLKPYRRASPDVVGLIETMQKARVPSNVFVDRGFSEDLRRAVDRRLRVLA